MECKAHCCDERLCLIARFNRNIVECKEPPDPESSSSLLVLIETLWNVKKHRHLNRSYHKPVLIETLWNVKFLQRITRLLQIRVLIETLWNVKSHGLAEISSLSASFNRNIVECKVVEVKVIGNTDLRFNRNIVECKVQTPGLRG